MTNSNPTADRTLLILLGAADFSKYLGRTEQTKQAQDAFAAAAKQVWDFFGDAVEGLGIPLDNRLWLFDLEDVYYQPLSHRIEEFIRRRDRAIGGIGAGDIIVYYIGHGAFFRDRYYLALRDTEKARPYDTGYPFEALADSLKRVASRKRKFFILDCCYAGAAFEHLHQGNPVEHVVREVQRSFPEAVTSIEPGSGAKRKPPTYGTALLSAVAKDNRAKLRDDLTSTVFTSHFLEVLKEEVSDNGLPFSLSSICEAMRSRIEENNLLPQCFTPEVALGDIAQIPLFKVVRRRKARNPGLLPSIFDVDVFATSADTIHCVVVSEEQVDANEVSLASDYTRQAIDKFGLQIAEIATDVRQSLEAQAERAVSAHAAQRRPFLSELPLADAFESKFALERAVEAMCLADVAVFDIGEYQPASMILLGIRAVVRRGVTICINLGGANGAKSPSRALEVATTDSQSGQPFNLQTIRVLNLCHVRSSGRADLLGVGMLTALRELHDLPHYLDLPAFDAVRRLGIDAQAYLPIDYGRRVLVLCSFSESYRAANWTFVEEGISARLKRKLGDLRAEGGIKGSAECEPHLARLSDLPSTRLVSQTLYESIRTTDMCIIDWSERRPNVMFELGVRLAVNALGAIHIVADTHAASDTSAGQMAQLKALFSPIPYLLQRGEVTAYDKMIERFEKSRRAGRQEPDCIIYEKIGAVLEQRRHRVGPDVVSDLIQNANLLSSDDESTGVSPVLYHEVNRSIRRMAAEAATERRIAAWLYMRHRYTLGEIASDYGRQIEFRRLAVSIRRALGSGMTREDKRGHALNVVREIAEEVAKLRRLKSIARLDVSRATIEDAMDEVQVIIDEAKLDRDQGAEGIQHAIIRLKQAVRLLERVGWSTGLGPRGVATDAQEKAAAKMADCLGMIGGNYRRIGDAKAALRWFKKGRKLEQDARFDIESTYNLGNEISTSIELGGKPGTPTMRASLRKALETMKRRTEGNRHRDRWAWADQGQCCLLLNDYEQAEKAYERFLNLGDRRATITSVLPVLAKLHQALVYSGDPTSESIALGIAYLEREATKLV